MHTIIMFGLHMLSYWYMVYRYDIERQNLKLDTFITAIKNSLRNQICVTLPATFFFIQWYPIEYDNLLYSIASLPIIIISGDIYFYLSHRPLHSKYLWYLHKSHHQGEVCVAKSLDADIIEHLFGNLGSFAAGFLFLRYFDFIVNIYIVHLWAFVATINTCISHSAGTAPCDSGVHHLHHKLLKCNYGTGLYLIDRLTGTYKKKRKIEYM
jgi:sterol desaturase/sphingolipid hydroxylase (fatty acid hydroxylase superfamily)